jgi:hypothetical protein
LVAAQVCLDKIGIHCQSVLADVQVATNGVAVLVFTYDCHTYVGVLEGAELQLVALSCLPVISTSESGNNSKLQPIAWNTNWSV